MRGIVRSPNAPAPPVARTQQAHDTTRSSLSPRGFARMEGHTYSSAAAQNAPRSQGSHTDPIQSAKELIDWARECMGRVKQCDSKISVAESHIEILLAVLFRHRDQLCDQNQNDSDETLSGSDDSVPSTAEDLADAINRVKGDIEGRCGEIARKVMQIIADYGESRACLREAFELDKDQLEVLEGRFESRTIRALSSLISFDNLALYHSDPLQACEEFAAYLFETASRDDERIRDHISDLQLHDTSAQRDDDDAGSVSSVDTQFTEGPDETMKDQPTAFDMLLLLGPAFQTDREFIFPLIRNIEVKRCLATYFREQAASIRTRSSASGTQNTSSDSRTPATILPERSRVLPQGPVRDEAGPSRVAVPEAQPPSSTVLAAQRRHVVQPDVAPSPQAAHEQP